MATVLISLVSKGGQPLYHMHYPLELNLSVYSGEVLLKWVSSIGASWLTHQEVYSGLCPTDSWPLIPLNH